MFDYFQFRLKLRKLQRKRDCNLSQVNVRVEEAKKERDNNKFQEEISEYFAIQDVYDDQISFLQTKYLRTMTDKHLIPIPDEEGTWIEAKTRSSHYYLSPQAAMKLQSLIHDAQVRIRGMWMPWVAMGIGLVGAVTGLVSVLSN